LFCRMLRIHSVTARLPHCRLHVVMVMLVVVSSSSGRCIAMILNHTLHAVGRGCRRKIMLFYVLINIDICEHRVLSALAGSSHGCSVRC
jgi:hypothetical protein